MDIKKNLSLPLSFHDRLNRQVLQLESSVAGLASRIELIMEKLGLQEKTKGNKSAGKLSVTKNDVSMEKSQSGSSSFQEAHKCILMLYGTYIYNI